MHELQILDILLDVPQCVCTLPQLGHLIVLQLLVDDTRQARGTQDRRKAQEDFILNAIHALSQTKEIRHRPVSTDLWLVSVAGYLLRAELQKPSFYNLQKNFSHDEFKKINSIQLLWIQCLAIPTADGKPRLQTSHF